MGLEMLESFPLVPVVIVALVIIFVVVFLSICYKKAPPTEAIVVTGLGHKEPKVVCGKGVFVIPGVQRADSLNMRVLKMDVKTPQSGVKTSEGVPLWIDSVVAAKVFSSNSTITEAEIREFGMSNREEFIQARQQAAISNFLGMSEEDINEKVNDVLQGNLREIVSGMTTMDVLTKRKEFAQQVMDNARPDLAKLGLEVVTFNIQDIKDAIDTDGRSHGVVEAIGVEQEMKVKRDAEVAKANAQRDMQIAKAKAAQEANEAQVASEQAIAENNNRLALKQSELKAQADRAAADADAAGRIQTQIQAKTLKEKEADAQIAAEEKKITLAARAAEVEQQRLDAEVRKRADADLYRRQKEAEAEQFEAERAAEAVKAQKEAEAAGALAIAKTEAEGIRMKSAAEAEGIRLKGIAEAEAMQKKADAYKEYGKAAMAEMLVRILPDVAREVSAPLAQIDKITLFGGGETGSGVDAVSGAVPSVLARTFQTVKEATGIDLAEIARSETYDAKVNRNINLTGLSGNPADMAIHLEPQAENIDVNVPESDRKK